MLQQSMEDTLLAYSNGSRGEVAYPMLHAPPWQGAETNKHAFLCERFYILKMITLPIQARDKRRQS
jgi:hypothetical protein